MPKETKRPLEEFDDDINKITQVRGEVYGHPAENFRAIRRLVEALPPFQDRRIQHMAEMICIKLCRISQTPDHVDSYVDIAGYARTGVMIIDREKE